MADDQIIETDALFTRPFRTLFGKKRHSWLTHKPKVQYVALVGRNVTTDTQTLDTTIDADGRLRVDAGLLGAGATVPNTGSSWTGMEVGETRWFTTTAINGNVDATLPTLASGTEEHIYEVLQLLHSLDCDATAASRIPTLKIVAGMPEQVTLNDWSQVGATSTTTENSKLFVPRGPATAKINDNGTITDGATSPLPMFIGEAGTITVTVASGVAGDLHLLSALVRKVA